MPAKVIILSGSMGCGKTTVMGEASDLLSIHQIAHACIDLDAVGAVLVPPDIAARLVGRNLAAVYANFVSAGIHHVLVAEPIESREQLDQLRDAMPGAEIVVCRLTAALVTLEERLRTREPGMHQAQFIARSRELDQVLDRAHVEDFVVVNDSRNVTDVAREVLRRAGWLA